MGNIDWRVELADLDYGEEERKAVLDILNGRWLTMGAVTLEFENQFAKMLGVKHAVAVTNATVALHLACLSLGVGPGDEIIVPSLSFVATSNAVLYTGAKVRFADIQGLDELTISPQEIERLITPQSKAVIVMHYGGYPCRMMEIQEIATRHGLFIIEDAAHAPGAFLNGKALGTWGEIGCFSFFSNKNLSTGEGGMLVTNRDDIAQRVRLMRSHGITHSTWDRHQGHAHTYDVIELGYNYRIDEIHSALGLVQLKKLTENNKRRKIITERYWKELENCSLKLPFRTWTKAEGVTPSFHIFPILLPDHIKQKTFMDKMRIGRVQTSIHYPPIHKFSYYQHRFPDIRLPNTEYVAEHEVTIPLYPTMADRAIDTVIQEIKKTL
jgi:dTDP-4-amino-4,6-dideoxygalactose transaminase